MSVVLPTAPAGKLRPEPTPRPVRWVFGAWRRFGWRQVALSALIFVLAGLFGPNGGVLLVPGRLFSDPVVDFLLGRWICRVMPLVFAAMVADEAHRDGVRPLSAYGVALLAGSLVAPFLDAFVGTLVGWGSPTFRMSSFSFSIKQNLLQGGLCMAVYAYWRTTQRALGQLRTSEAGRVRDRQQLLAAKLMTLQARVEPQFLFDALSRVGDLHERDPVAADILLSDLIALLRAMPPVGTGSISTVEREFALGQAWLRVHDHLDHSPEIEIAASPTAASAGLGPMLVLPLLQETLRLPQARTVGWRLSAEIVPSEEATARTPRLHVRLAPATDAATDTSGTQCDERPCVVRVRERLAELYGATASLSVAIRADGAATFALDLPLVEDIAG